MFRSSVSFLLHCWDTVCEADARSVHCRRCVIANIRTTWCIIIFWHVRLWQCQNEGVVVGVESIVLRRLRLLQSVSCRQITNHSTTMEFRIPFQPPPPFAVWNGVLRQVSYSTIVLIYRLREFVVQYSKCMWPLFGLHNLEKLAPKGKFWTGNRLRMGMILCKRFLIVIVGPQLYSELALGYDMLWMKLEIMYFSFWNWFQLMNDSI